MKNVSILALLAFAFAFVACDEAVDEPTSTQTGLSLAIEDTAVFGAFSTEDDGLTFFADEVGDQVFELTVELHDMTLDAYIDAVSGVATLDGFASDTGEDTQILAEDRDLLWEFYQALNQELPEDSPHAGVLLRRKVGGWAEQPDTVDLTRVVMGEEGRTIQYLCGYVNCGSNTGSCAYWNWYAYSTHDCCYGGIWGLLGTCTDRYDSDTTQVVQLGDHYNSGCDDGTYTWNGSGWETCEKDHWSYPYEVGNCFGRSGGGCGGDTQYTKDATDHDGCVRNGHETASLWCDDEFASAVDDELWGDDCY
jgi:hypothetical protein